MANDVAERRADQVRGRPFAKGQSGSPGGRRRGSRNKATLAARMLLADEAEPLTRKAVELDFDRRLQLLEASRAAYPPGIAVGKRHSTNW